MSMLEWMRRQKSEQLSGEPTSSTPDPRLAALALRFAEAWTRMMLDDRPRPKEPESLSSLPLHGGSYGYDSVEHPCGPFVSAIAGLTPEKAAAIGRDAAAYVEAQRRYDAESQARRDAYNLFADDYCEATGRKRSYPSLVARRAEIEASS